MVYLKSILAGLVAVIGTMVLAVIGFVVLGWWTSQRHSKAAGEGVVAYDIRVLVMPVAIIVGLIFVAGFWWEFRRATRARLEQ